MKKITILFLFIFSSVITYSQDFEFDFRPSSLNEEILKNETSLPSKKTTNVSIDVMSYTYDEKNLFA